MPLTDYAELSQADEWLRHPVLGDPSFDSFQHSAANPLHVGAPPLEWPVNGFLFADPVSGNWYLYVGAYMRGYWTADETSVPARCILFRSRNRGQAWEKLGAIWAEDLTLFDSDGRRPGHLPDVSVTYADGRYHLSYDYQRLDHRDGGIGYAVADRPEGPFVRARQPIHSSAAQPVLLGKYRRMYAQTLLRRRHDWLVLAMMDSGPFFSWALVALTAREPAGPYTAPVFLRTVDQDTYHPALMEYYPAFTHEGYVYAPCTSVALNRNFQMLFRAPLEAATDPGAWAIVRAGSVWHAEDVPGERDGIWGQTYSGFVDQAGRLHVMFPSRNAAGCGTINLAARPWDAPLRQRGFHFSGHRGRSLTLLRRRYDAFRLDATLRLRGTARIIWSGQAPLGPDRPAADATLHPLSLTRHEGLELAAQAWRVVSVEDTAASTVRAAGSLAATDSRRVEINRTADGLTDVRIDGEAVWSGRSPAPPGALGLLAEADSHLEVSEFRVTGKPAPLTISYLYTEALLGAGVNLADWTEPTDPGFRFGVGAVCREPGGRAKWNFEGRGFRLWSPRGPDGGTVEVLLDGESVATLDLRAAAPAQSRPVLERGALARGRHAVVVRATAGCLTVDSLEVQG